MADRIQTLHGHAIPPAEGHSSEHAVTVHLPTWQTALDFMDRKPAMMQSLKNMYPRMMLHPSVKKLCGIVSDKFGREGWTCLLFTNAIAPSECLKFASSPARGPLAISREEMYYKTLEIQQRFWAVFFPLSKTPCFMPYWLNAGIGISSRLAEEALAHIDSLRETSSEASTPHLPESFAHNLVRERVASLLNRSVEHLTVAAHDVYLYQTGIAAIYQVYKYLLQDQEAHIEPTILFGFAFFATAFTLNDFGPAYKFFGRADCDELEAFLAAEESEGRRVRAVVTEFPANPLLFTPDVKRLRGLADRYKFVLIVDDTVSSSCNVDLLGPDGVDVVVASLTKSFNGYSDVMAGSAVLNPCLARYQELKKLFDDSYRNEFFAGDAEMLERNSRDYLQRSAKLNTNGQAMVDYFSGCAKDASSALVSVYHPSTNPSRDNYEAYMRPRTAEFEPGFSGLFTIEFETLEATRAFYDVLSKGIHIGPHLGAHVTIALAYVQLLYGKELDKVAECGLNERQIRFSAGLEPIEELLAVVRGAMAAADAYKVHVVQPVTARVEVKHAISEVVAEVPAEAV